MKMRKIAGTGLAWTCLALAAWAAGCESEPDKPAAPGPLAPFVLPDIEPESVAASFSIAVDTTAVELEGEDRQPLATPVTVMGGDANLGLRVFAKRPPARAGEIWLEIFVENKKMVGLREVTVTVKQVTGAKAAIDVTNKPLSTDPVVGAIQVGGVPREGLSRIAMVLTEPMGSVQVNVDVAGVTTAREAKNSSPIAISPDASEVWSVFADSNIVGVINAATNQRVAQVTVPEGPVSLAISPDGAHVLVVSHLANTVTVIDRASRKVIQTLGANEGLGKEPRHIVIADDGTHAFVSDYVDDKIVRLLRRGNRYEIDATVVVGRRPAGLSVSSDGSQVLVAHYLPRGRIRMNEAWVSVIDATTMTLSRDLALPDNFNEDRVKCLADVFGVNPVRLTMESVATALSGIFLNPAGTTGWVPGMRVSPVPVMELGMNHQDLGAFTNGVRGRFSPAFLFMIDSRVLSETEPMRAYGALDIPNLNLNYVKCVDPELDIEFTTATSLDPDRQVNTGVANPNGNAGLTEHGRMDFVAFSRGARRALGLSSLSDEMMVYDASTLHPVSQKHFLLSGANPYGMAVSADGKRAYVAYRNSTFVSVVDTSAYADALPEPYYVPFRFSQIPELGASQSPITNRWLVRTITNVPQLPALQEIAQVPLVDADPLPPLDRRGRILFSSSSPAKYPELSSSRQAACATCHPDGGSDGSGWPTVEGERRTMSLRGGTAGRGWLHASATHQSPMDFATTIVEQRLGGKPDAATSDALARYVAFGIPTLQGPTVDNALANQGKTIFATKCAGCHAGEKFDSGASDPNHPFRGGANSGPVLFDVGTKTDAAGMLFGNFFESIFPPAQAEFLGLVRGDRDLGAADPLQMSLDFEPRPERLAGQFKAPSLVGVWDQVVFFHDGRYDKLEDVVSYLNTQLKLNLTADDQKAVIEYLKTL